MSDDRQRILKMVAEGKISVAEAEELLDALGDTEDRSDVSSGDVAVRPRRAKYLRVVVEEGGKGMVNIRVPMQLIYAGVKLTGLIPRHASEKVSGALHERGIDVDLDALGGERIQELVDQLQDLSVDVDGPEGERVRVYCE